MNQARLIMVCGVGRSGTTLLQAILSAHPDVAAIPETGFFRRYCLNSSLEKVHAKSGKTGVIELLRADTRFQRLSSGLKMASDYLDTCTMFSAADLYRHILQSQITAQRTPFICDKDPRMIEHLPALSEEFGEDLAVVHIVRDPRAVLASKKNAEWSESRTILWHMLANRVQYQAGTQFGSNPSQSTYCRVTYENLVSKTEEELIELGGMLRLEFDSSMLKHNELAASIISEEENWKVNVLQPIDETKVHAWNDELTPFEKGLVEKTCKGILLDNQYQLSSTTESLSLVNRIMIRLAAATVDLADVAYRFKNTSFGISNVD